MPSEIEILGRVRGSAAPDLMPYGDMQPAVNGRGDLLTALGLPPSAEVVRMGNSWWTILGTAVAPVVAIPTTAALLSLWNGEADNGKSYVIDSVGVMVAVSAAAASGVGVLACLNRGKKTAPTATVLTVGTLSGKGTYGGKAVTAINQTITNDGWMPVGSSVIGAASQIGTILDIPLKGGIIVPPGGMLNLTWIANTVTSITGVIFVRWHEIALALG